MAIKIEGIFLLNTQIKYKFLSQVGFECNLQKLYLFLYYWEALLFSFLIVVKTVSSTWNVFVRVQGLGSTVRTSVWMVQSGSQRKLMYQRRRCAEWDKNKRGTHTHTQSELISPSSAFNQRHFRTLYLPAVPTSSNPLPSWSFESCLFCQCVLLKHYDALICF